MILKLGKILQDDLRWLAYWSGFRFFDLPKATGGQQTIEPR